MDGDKLTINILLFLNRLCGAAVLVSCLSLHQLDSSLAPTQVLHQLDQLLPVCSQRGGGKQLIEGTLVSIRQLSACLPDSTVHYFGGGKLTSLLPAECAFPGSLMKR